MFTVLMIVLLWLSPTARASGHGRPYRCEQIKAGLAQADFEVVMNEIAAGWNDNNARRAASCFTPDALYSSMPNPNARKGRASLYEWFGGEKGRPRPMRIEWHHLLFDAGQQIGAGEYTFKYEVQTHGVVIVKFKDGLVSNWREYEAQSPKPWKAVIGDNNF